LLPLVALADAAQVKPIGETKELAVMIANIRGHEVGLLGAMPVDVIETRAQIDQTTHRQKGVAVHHHPRPHRAGRRPVRTGGRTWPEWAAQQAVLKPRSANAEHTAVLLAEDSDFFRTQITRFLEEDGYRAGGAGRRSRLGAAAQEPGKVGRW